MAKLAELKAVREQTLEKMSALAESDGFGESSKAQDQFAALQKKFEATQRQIEAVIASQEAARGQAKALDGTGAAANMNMPDTPARDVARKDWSVRQYVEHSRKRLGFTPQPEKHFRSLGEQLQAVARYYMPEFRQMDNRLIRAPSGASEMDPSSGGFLVQIDFADSIFTRAYDMGELLGRAMKLTISTNANGIKIPGVDETSRVTGSRWGGVQSYWVAEGTSVTATKPKFRIIELDLKKLMSTMYLTDEILADAAILETLAMQAFSEEITFMTEDAMYEGSGAGMPLGILNAPCKVAVAKETGQPATTIQYENVLKMWARMWARSRPNAIWTINQDCEPALLSLSQVIGTAGVPVYLPANGISGAPYGTLFGRPVVPVEYNSTLGTEGDIVLADWSQYVLADKGGVQAASSMHVAFLTDEMVFRITYRIDGQPLWNSALTPFKGTQTKSPFITLASR